MEFLNSLVLHVDSVEEKFVIDFLVSTGLLLFVVYVLQVYLVH